jgi:hypothetical protein
MNFYVELPADKDGNTYYTKAVIEGRIVPGEYGANLMIYAPAEVARKWPSVRAWGFAETEGPARLLTRPEWETLIRSAKRK